MKAQWTGSAGVILSTPEELYAVIDSVRQLGAPTVIYLENTGVTLAFSVGGDEAIVSWYEADGTSCHSLGDLSRTGHVQMWNCGQLDDFLVETLVPAQVAIDAAMEFVVTGLRPGNLRWEGD